MSEHVTLKKSWTEECHKKVTPFAASMEATIDVQGSEYLPVVANHPEGKVEEAKSLPSANLSSGTSVFRWKKRLFNATLDYSRVPLL